MLGRAVHGADVEPGARLLAPKLLVIPGPKSEAGERQRCLVLGQGEAPAWEDFDAFRERNFWDVSEVSRVMPSSMAFTVNDPDRQNVLSGGELAIDREGNYWIWHGPRDHVWLSLSGERPALDTPAPRVIFSSWRLELIQPGASSLSLFEVKTKI